MQRSQRRLSRLRRAFSLSEALMVLAIMSALIAFALPAVQRVRENSRRVTCTNHLQQIGIVAHTHEAAHQAFPYTSTTFSEDGGPTQPAISPHIALLAILDPGLHGQLDLTDASGNTPDRPPSSANNRVLFQHSVPLFRCPSDNLPPGANSYRANLGVSPNISRDGPPKDGEAQKGAFVHNQALQASTFTDGLSHTAFFSERVVGDGDRQRYDPFRDRYVIPVPGQMAETYAQYCGLYAVANPQYHDSYAGHTWIFGGWQHTWYNHILTPNATEPDCSNAVNACRGGCPGAYTPRSFHPGGVNVLFADGAVKFVTNKVDVNIWRAVGTRNGEERIGLEF